MTESTHTYLQLKVATAAKLGPRAEGGITYAVLADADKQALYLTITANSGGGYFSRDIVPMAAVERCLPDDAALPFPAKVFARAFQGKSANNAGFMAAILRSEGLLAPVENKANLHQIAGDWSGWKSTMLALEGNVYVPPDKAGVSLATITQEEVPPDDGQHRRKGRKGNGGQSADEGDHARPT